MSDKLSEQLLGKLYDPIENEQKESEDELRHLSPDNIISRAYEITNKEDIAVMPEYEEPDIEYLKRETQREKNKQDGRGAHMRTFFFFI